MSSDGKRIARSVRLTPEVTARLTDLCTHLGVNPNAYLVAEIGKAVARDEITYKVSTQSKALFDSAQLSLENMGSDLESKLVK